MSGVRAQGVRKSFGSRVILDGVDLTVAPGEVVGLIGPNGAGKTTLMSCLLGFIRIDEGEITFDGRVNTDVDTRALIGFVPERVSLEPRITGRQFIRYMARLSGVPRETVNGRVDALLERVELSAAADRPMRQYSRGMLQRTALCQALVHEPKYLFLDEPTSALDPNGVLLVRDLIDEQRRRGAAVLLNSHQLAEVEKVCDRVLFLRKGAIARAETLRNLAQITVSIRLLHGSYDPELVHTITGVEPHDDVAMVTAATDVEIASKIRELVVSGVDVVEVRHESPDLEGIFRERS